MKKLRCFVISLIFVQFTHAQEVGDVNAYFSFPVVSNLTTAAGVSAWVLNEEGVHNIYLATSLDDEGRRLTNYTEDDGLLIEQLALDRSGNWAVYVKGGELGGNWSREVPVNPTSEIGPQKITIFSVSTDGTSSPVALGEGSNPIIAPNNRDVFFAKAGQVFRVPIDRSEVPMPLLKVRGSVKHLRVSPDGKKLAFSVDRRTHSFIGTYDFQESHIEWISPSMDRDEHPRWSGDSKSLAFVRRPGESTQVDSILRPSHAHWEIRSINLDQEEAELVWQAPETDRGSFPGSVFMEWSKSQEIIFLSYHDGWPHLYAVSLGGAKPRLLTPGPFHVEDLRMDDTRTPLLFTANTGKTPGLNIDRRHVFHWGEAYFSSSTLRRVHMTIMANPNSENTAKAYRKLKASAI